MPIRSGAPAGEVAVEGQSQPGGEHAHAGRLNGILCPIRWWLIWLGTLVLTIGWAGWLRPLVFDDTAPRESGIDWLGFDVTLCLTLWLLMPLAWFVRAGFVIHRRDLLEAWNSCWASQSPAEIADLRLSWSDWLWAAGIAGLAFWIHSTVGQSFDHLPPAYHDEFSYRLQAETILQRHWSVPSLSDVPHVFDQIHVLNEGRFASRYYPGNGLWLAPGVALGQPYLGPWLAGSLAAWLAFWTGRRLSGRGVGILAGLLVAISPGIVLFGNTLLAHQPCLVGIALLLYGYVTFRDRPTAWSLICIGTGVGWSTLCRPATGVSVGATVACAILWNWLQRARAQTLSRSTWTREFAILLAPCLAALAVMLSYNHAVTGRLLTSPYQQYTDLYTPRHVYGFYNVERGAAAQQGPLPAVTAHYDAWAEDLTPALAVQNECRRLSASWNWTVGFIPSLCSGLVWLALPTASRRRWGIIPAAILALHLMHVPYWFDGIFHWHYVYESGWMWCLLVAGMTGELTATWQRTERPWLPLWWSAVLIAGLSLSWFSVLPWWLSPFDRAWSEMRFARQKYGQFRQLLAQQVHDFPALVLVKPDPADRHMDFVTNGADLHGPLLIGRLNEDETRFEQIAQAFPERALYVFDARTGTLNWRRAAVPVSADRH